MTDETHIPAEVLALASSVPQLGPLPPHPAAWRKTADGWVIIFDDGRKLTFVKEPAPPAPPAKKGKGKA